MTNDLRHDHDLRERALRLGLHGLLANWDEVNVAARLPAVIAYEESDVRVLLLEHAMAAVNAEIANNARTERTEREALIVQGA